MTATRSTTWFWSDWIGDEAVRRLTPSERGVWIDLLALASAGSPTGYVCDAKGRPLTLAEICRVTNAASPDEVAKLIDGILEKGAASRDRTGRLFNRRMVRDAELRAKRSRAGKIGAAHTNLMWQQIKTPTRHMTHQVTRQTNGKVTDTLPVKKESSSTNSESEDRRRPASLAEVVRAKGWAT